jgi:hypothetical protein
VSTVPALGSLEGRPVRAEWVLDVQQRAGSTGTGFVRDWWLDFTSDNCLHFQGNYPLPTPSCFIIFII